MNKIFNGRRYDTESAKRIASWSNGSDTRNFSYCAETLYRKTTGEYFLHGEGHGQSKYAEYDASGWSGWGEKIIPMSEEAARKWAEEHCSADEYESIFGPAPEGVTSTIPHFEVPKDDAEKLRRLAMADGVPVAEYLRRVIHGL